MTLLTQPTTPATTPTPATPPTTENTTPPTTTPAGTPTPRRSTPVTAPAPTTLFPRPGTTGPAPRPTPRPHPGPGPATTATTPHTPEPDPGTEEHTVIHELRHLLFDGDEQDTLHTPWRNLITHPDFLTPDHHLTPAQRTTRSYQRLHHLNATTAGDPLTLAQDPRRLAALHEWTGIADSALATLAGIHYNLFLGTLLDHDPHQRDLTPYTTLQQTGTFLITERAHGNDAAHLETTAHHHPDTGEFTLHTPHPGAAKFMPNTTTLGGPKTALVAARLITHDGTDRGIHLFLTPLHNHNGPHPGIHITPLPPRHLPHPVDHALTTFTHVRLPPTALLQAPHTHLTPNGTHHTTHGNPQKRFLTTIDRVTLGKLCMSAAATGTARAALTIAVHYANHRHTTHHNTPTPLTTHRAHHAPLIDHLATTYALTLLHRHTLNHHTHHHHNGPTPPTPPPHPHYPTDPPPTKQQTHHLTALTKAFTTHHARTITTTCRERCGAWALHPHNPLAHYTQQLEGTITAEGDNLLITLKAATHLLLNPPPPPPTTTTPPNPLTNLTHLKNLLHHAQHIWHNRTKQALHTPTHPHTPHTRWNNATNPALTMTHLHTTLHTTNALLNTLNHTTHPTTHTHLKNLTNLYLLNQLTPHTPELLTHHHLTPHHHNQIHTTINHLHNTLHPHLTTLTHALNHPHQHTPTPPPN
ncbi:acyl-CoA dehydrogenase family protein, partial [Streptomyces sp. NPDC002996]